MKTKTHPTLKLAKVVCTGCGNEFEVLSVRESITVNICNKCHPFFTGTKKLLDTEGRIEKFERRYKEAQEQNQEKQNQKKQEKKQSGRKKTILKKLKS